MKLKLTRNFRDADLINRFIANCCHDVPTIICRSVNCQFQNKNSDCCCWQRERNVRNHRSELSLAGTHGSIHGGGSARLRPPRSNERVLGHNGQPLGQCLNFCCCTRRLTMSAFEMRLFSLNFTLWGWEGEKNLNGRWRVPAISLSEKAASTCRV
jgi:hypothetical protein